jgi:pyruvate/2-oxoacid:ferredoxin oxidoreductase beta subunit
VWFLGGDGWAYDTAMAVWISACFGRKVNVLVWTPRSIPTMRPVVKSTPLGAVPNLAAQTFDQKRHGLIL